jgi:bifunctional enzyme CysN/CysC
MPHPEPLPADLESFFQEQSQQDQLRFITCGSVDDGKSTLIGRLLWDARHLFDDQRASLEVESRKFGTQGGKIDFALLVDGLAAEREQGITIDVAYRYFSTARRKFIVADTPGHAQYTRNMATGASNADVAILLVDARKGLLDQTRRHAFLASLMGIRHVALAVNKMDLVRYDATVFGHIVQQFEAFASSLEFTTMTALPVSALEGDNITSRSAHTPWYNGPTLMGYLETIDVVPPRSDRLVLPVQWVCRPDSDFRGICGTVAEGCVRVGDSLRITGSGHCATIAEIVTLDGPLDQACAGDAVTLTFDRAMDISRGDVLSPEHTPLEVTDQFEATIIWMDQEAGLAGRNYEIKLATQWAQASITSIKYGIDIQDLSQRASTRLDLNDIAVCNIATSKPLVFDRYAHSKTLGGFILVDRFSHATVAAGLIRHSLRRAQNVHWQALAIRREDRERMNAHSGCVIWFTGLSGSGKSTLANALEIELHRQGKRTYLLDGDNIRQGLNKDLGFSDADRVENIRRIAEVARLMMDAGLIVMTAFISPFRREREMARDLIGAARFIEVFVDTPLSVCEARDAKGLYKKARSGQIPNMTGINSPYEAPQTPDCVIDAGTESIESAVTRLNAMLNTR